MPVAGWHVNAMAKFTRIETVQKLKNTGLVPVFYHAEVDVTRKVLQAAYQAGVHVFEFTNRGDKAHHVFSDLIDFARKELPGMAMGVGSVIDAPTAALYMQLGADFIVSPILDAATAEVCNQRKVLWSPGCGTPSEIDRAHRLGAEIVKIFPGTQVGGPGFVKAIKGPMPWTEIMPTGGVSPEKENLQAWFDAGVACVGMGSKLINKQLIEERDFSRIQADIKKAYQLIQDIRSL